MPFSPWVHGTMIGNERDEEPVRARDQPSRGMRYLDGHNSIEEK